MPARIASGEGRDARSGAIGQGPELDLFDRRRTGSRVEELERRLALDDSAVYPGHGPGDFRLGNVRGRSRLERAPAVTYDEPPWLGIERVCIAKRAGRPQADRGTIRREVRLVGFVHGGT